MKKLFAIMMMLAAIVLSAEELAVKGNFPAPRKPGLPPAGWNKMSGSKGSIEVIPAENGNAVMLAAENGARCGIYSPAVAAKAGDKIKVSAQIKGEKVALGIFQYSNPRGTTAQRRTVTAVNGVAEAEFTVADTRKGVTNAIRVCVYAENGQGVSVLNIKAVRE
ncbi:MAG: hypothetical protein IJW35_01905 [Lentisphaeria bacterium]|nr:hypothetical protein [Lentisphaeria bacterium]